MCIYEGNAPKVFGGARMQFRQEVAALDRSPAGADRLLRGGDDD